MSRFPGWRSPRSSVPTCGSRPRVPGPRPQHPVRSLVPGTQHSIPGLRFPVPGPGHRPPRGADARAGIVATEADPPRVRCRRPPAETPRAAPHHRPRPRPRPSASGLSKAARRRRGRPHRRRSLPSGHRHRLPRHARFSGSRASQGCGAFRSAVGSTGVRSPARLTPSRVAARAPFPHLAAPVRVHDIGVHHCLRARSTRPRAQGTGVHGRASSGRIGQRGRAKGA